MLGVANIVADAAYSDVSCGYGRSIIKLRGVEPNLFGVGLEGAVCPAGSSSFEELNSFCGFLVLHNAVGKQVDWNPVSSV